MFETHMRQSREVVLLAALLASASLSQAHDWFVRAGSQGDGTKERPFKDPYLALEEAEPGDTIHIAQGVYHGRLNCGNWVIATRDLTFLGGYKEDFTKRDPWRWPSQLRFSKEFEGKNNGTLIQGGEDHDNLVLDGFILDQKERNHYGGEPDSSLLDGSDDGPLIRLSSPGVQIRNCILLNGSEGGIELSGGGCRVENNLLLNMCQGPCVGLRSRDGKEAILRGNTVLFSWSDRGVGSAGTRAGCGFSFWNCDAEVELNDNIFLGCDNVAAAAGNADKFMLKGNVFWLNGWLDVSVQAKDQTVRVDNSSLADLEDAGLRQCEANTAANPELNGLDQKWMEKFLDRLADEYPNAKLEELNEMRKSLGLSAANEKKARSRVNHAMAYDWAQALKIVPSRLKAGAHPVALEVKPFSAPSPAIAYNYEQTTWRKFTENPRNLDGKRVEIIGALGREYEIFGFEGIKENEYRGFEFHDVQEQLGQCPVIYVRKGTKADRMFKGLNWWDGNGTPSEKHLVRGLAKYDSGSTLFRKGTVLVDSISAVVEQPVAAQNRPRPVGRNWFVRAGSTGNGSRDSPFKDPWQALDVAKSGDAIHVTEGEYFGKFKSGTWTIKIPYLSLIGGYDRDFTERDPWRHPTRLGYSPGTSTGGSQPYIVGEEDHTGFIFDGFVLDGRDVNPLDSNGNLAYRFPERELLTVYSPDAIVRNCILVNAGGPAIRACGGNTHIENNIVFNCNYYSIDISRRPDSPFIIRNNTILFTWHASREGGSRPGGSAIWTCQGTLFELDNNIIGYADGQGVAGATEPKRLKIVNNAFTHNRSANFTDLDKIVVTDKTMDLMKELGLGAADGNVVIDPQMPFDKTWWAEYSRDQSSAFFARPYDWKQAIKLVPQNPACRAGARPVKLEVHLGP
jgi:hypothetical protein